MAYSYSGDPTGSDLDKYRFLTGDTGEAVVEISTDNYVPVDEYAPRDAADQRENWILSDEEINFILNLYTAHNSRMYMLCKACANILSRDIRRSLGPQSEDPTTRTKHYVDQAEYYRKLSSLSGLSSPVYSMDKIFVKGMHDNV